MRIAIAAQGDNVSAHFGHCEGFMMYDMDGETAPEGKMLANPGHQPGFLPVFLKEKGVDLVIAGGMGERAQMLFAQNGIDVIVGANGSCGDAIASYTAGRLVSTGEACKEHGHNCG